MATFLLKCRIAHLTHLTRQPFVKVWTHNFCMLVIIKMIFTTQSSTKFRWDLIRFDEFDVVYQYFAKNCWTQNSYVYSFGMIKVWIIEMVVIPNLNSNMLIHIQIFKDVVNDWIFEFIFSKFVAGSCKGSSIRNVNILKGGRGCLIVFFSNFRAQSVYD